MIIMEPNRKRSNTSGNATVLGDKVRIEVRQFRKGEIQNIGEHFGNRNRRKKASKQSPAAKPAFPRKGRAVFQDIVAHDTHMFFSFYLCPIVAGRLLKKNQAPSANNSACIPLKIVEKGDSRYPPELQISLASDLVPSFLGYIHAFTAVGLQADAYAYSAVDCCDVLHLVLYPQHNSVDSATSLLHTESQYSDSTKFSLRCWLICIHVQTLA